jgi:hypothetical protein
MKMDSIFFEEAIIIKVTITPERDFADSYSLRTREELETQLIKCLRWFK